MTDPDEKEARRMAKAMIGAIEKEGEERSNTTYMSAITFIVAAILRSPHLTREEAMQNFEVWVEFTREYLQRVELTR